MIAMLWLAEHQVEIHNFTADIKHCRLDQRCYVRLG